MADEFREFDKSAILGKLKLNRCNFGIKELILAIIATLLLILVLIFAGLFGKAKNDLSNTPEAAEIVGNAYCTSKSCLDTAARAMDFMNLSVDPCENFYQYSCGNYKKLNPVGYFERKARTVLNDIYKNNINKLTNLLAKPIDRMNRFQSEVKLKQFFHACNDDFEREKKKGTPLLQKVLPQLGGWDLIGTWNNVTWNFEDSLQKVQGDFWTDALYAPRVTEGETVGTHMVEIHPAGLGKFMRLEWYLDFNNQDQQAYINKFQEDYKKFIRRVGTYLLRDYNTSLYTDNDVKQEKLESFVNDTFQMETIIAQAIQFAVERDFNSVTDDTDESENYMSLDELQRETGNRVNWVGQLNHIFQGASISRSTRVYVHQLAYFKNVTSAINNLPEENKKRILHNYLIWRVVERYVQELSWDYIHANREIFEDTKGYTAFMGIYRYCFSATQKYLHDALGALYIKDFFTQENKDTVKDITDYIQKELVKQLKETPWMDEATKKIAMTKLSSVRYKMGYPDWMAKKDEVDRVYATLNVDPRDHFGNMLNGNNFHRKLWSKDLQEGLKREEWTDDVYNTIFGIRLDLNELVAPAGVLQDPVYNSEKPHCSTFGSLGSLIGRFMHHVVDDYGKHFDQTGHFLGVNRTWWSNNSVNKYKEVHTCVLNAYKNVTVPVKYPTGIRVFRFNARSHVQTGIAWTNGIRLALRAYDWWVRDKGIGEKQLPGLELTNDQMIFVSHAQTFCESRNRLSEFMSMLKGKYPMQLKINMAVSQLPEFSKAFGCKKSSKMNLENKCDFY